MVATLQRQHLVFAGSHIMQIRHLHGQINDCDA